MTQTLLNHIQGKNGSEWTQFVKSRGVEQIIVVAIDVAKYTHKAMISTYYGEVLVPAFEFDASTSGFLQLKACIQETFKGTNTSGVVIGIETTGHYYEDLVRLCGNDQYFLRIINAVTTKEKRKAILNHSKTDNIDLMAITMAVIQGYGSSTELRSGKLEQLRKLTRARRSLVHKRTAIKNEICVRVDHIFREFQGKTIKVDGATQRVKIFSNIFGKSGRYIMGNCLHPEDLLSLGEKGLRELSITRDLKLRDESIRRLLAFAKGSISKPKTEVEAEHFLLKLELEQLDTLDQHIKALEDKIEALFIQTEGAVILAVSGIGVPSGAEFFAEMGNHLDFDNANQLIKMAGTNPIVNQSGDRKPTYYSISKQGRRAFRNSIYQVGKSLSTHNPEMKKKYEEFKARGKHHKEAYIAVGNKMIRIAFAMIRKQSLYHTNADNYDLYSELSKKLKKEHVEQFYQQFVMPKAS